MEQVRIDFVPGGVTPNAHASQYDIGRVIRFKLYNSGSPYTLIGTETITVKMTKPDGTEETISLTNTSSDYVDFTTTDGLLNQAGIYPCEISLTAGGDIIGSQNFNLKAEADAYGNANIVILSIGPLPICTFDTTLAEPYQSVTVDVLASQSGSGTPYPAGGSAQKWDEEWEAGGIDAQGENITVGTRIRSKNYIPCIPSTSYYFNIPSNKGLYRVYYNANKELISAGWWNGHTAYTTPEDCYYIRFSTGDAYGSTYNHDLSINYPSTDHDYHPYSNIRPINGYTEANITRCGVNLIPQFRDSAKTQNGITVTPQADGSLRLTGKSTSSSNFLISMENYTKVFPSGTYTFSIGNFDNYVYAQIVASGHNLYSYSGKDTFTYNSGLSISRLDIGITGSAYNINIDITIYPQLELGSTDTQYNPYNGNTYTIAFGQTVYGGYLEYKNGAWVFTGTHYFSEYDGAEDWYEGSSTTYFALFNQPSSKSNTDLTQLCNIAIAGGNDYISFGKFRAQTNGAICIGNRNPDSTLNWADVTAFKAYVALNHIQVCYELATPFDIDLTPVQISALALPDSNNVYADCGETEVDYLAEGT